MKILLTSTSFQDTPGKHHDLLNNQGFLVDTLRGPVSEEVLLPIIQNYDAVICGDDDYTEAVIKKGKEGKLRFISKYGVGLDRINLEAAKKYNIPVTNCPGVNQVSVAEHVLALLFTFEKNIHLQYQSTKEGSWNRLTGNEVSGRTLGIIGFGAIGKELAKKSNALGMRVLAFDINYRNKHQREYPEVHFAESIEEIYQSSDVISLHIPHTPQTEKLISHEVIFGKLKKNPVVINTARGMLVDTTAIIEGLSSGVIRGYLADVLAVEPISEKEKLKGVKNVIITPHVGSRTIQSVQRQGTMAVENLLKMIDESITVA